MEYSSYSFQFPSDSRSVREDNEVFSLFLFFSCLSLTLVYTCFRAFPVFNAQIRITTFCLFLAV